MRITSSTDDSCEGEGLRGGDVGEGLRGGDLNPCGLPYKRAEFARLRIGLAGCPAGGGLLLPDLVRYGGGAPCTPVTLCCFTRAAGASSSFIDGGGELALSRAGSDHATSCIDVDVGLRGRKGKAWW